MHTSAVREGEALVSVIVPAYNCAQYLEQCLADIVGQTYDNLQIVVVDDGSTDDTPQVADRYARQDTRMVVVHTRNHGHSYARNAGYNLAEGAWVWFVDADDRLCRNAVELLVKSAAANAADLVVANFVPFDERRSLPRTQCLPQPFPAAASSDGMGLGGSILLGALGGYAWQFFSSRTVLKKLEQDDALFPSDVRLFEDVSFSLRLAHAAEKVSYIREPLYFYRQLQTSAAHDLKPDTIRQGMHAIELVGRCVIPRELEPLRNECMCRLYLYLYESDRHGSQTASLRREIRSKILLLAEEDDSGFSRTVRVKVQLLRAHVLIPAGTLVRITRGLSHRMHPHESRESCTCEHEHCMNMSASKPASARRNTREIKATKSKGSSVGDGKQHRAIPRTCPRLLKAVHHAYRRMLRLVRSAAGD